jgi:ATP synthase protein I
MNAPDRDEFEDEFETRIGRQRERIEAGRAEQGRSFWQYVGLIGMVGWSVVVPMLLGILLGLWLDRRLGTGYLLTLLLMLAGLLVGGFNAWRIVTREQ